MESIFEQINHLQGIESQKTIEINIQKNENEKQYLFLQQRNVKKNKRNEMR